MSAKDSPDKRLGKDMPYGVYDQTLNKGWVSVGIDHDTARFATEMVRRWWNEMGRPTYRIAKELLITADGGDQQRDAEAVVEGVLAASGRRDGLAGGGLSLPAGDEQME